MVSRDTLLIAKSSKHFWRCVSDQGNHLLRNENSFQGKTENYIRTRVLPYQSPIIAMWVEYIGMKTALCSFYIHWLRNMCTGKRWVQVSVNLSDDIFPHVLIAFTPIKKSQDLIKSTYKMRFKSKTKLTNFLIGPILFPIYLGGIFLRFSSKTGFKMI